MALQGLVAEMSLEPLEDSIVYMPRKAWSPRCQCTLDTSLISSLPVQEGAKDDSVTYAFGVVQYSAFLQQAAGDLAGAQAAFAAALGKRTNGKALWEVR